MQHFDAELSYQVWVQCAISAQSSWQLCPAACLHGVVGVGLATGQDGRFEVAPELARCAQHAGVGEGHHRIELRGAAAPQRSRLALAVLAGSQ